MLSFGQYENRSDDYMRMRKKKHGKERLDAAAHLLCIDPAQTREDPYAPFGGAEKPLHLEIGCGKGQFAVGMAAAHPDVDFYALERVSDVMVCAVEKAMAAREGGFDNLRFIVGDAGTLAERFAPHTFDCIYLNFSDPWPKAGHYKRRLTYRGYLELYKRLLKPGGVLRLKTDNEGLYDFSLEEFAATGMRVVAASRDLHNSPYADGNIMTEYETNFAAQGMPIYFAEVTPD